PARRWPPNGSCPHRRCDVACRAGSVWPMDRGLNPAQRSAAREAATTQELDVLVVGGGVVGAGAALDASTRGLRVGLVEMRDWASGTSSRSSKLIHGGLRYLEMLDFGLVRERSEEHTSELQSRFDLVCRLLLEKNNKKPQAMRREFI